MILSNRLPIRLNGSLAPTRFRGGGLRRFGAHFVSRLAVAVVFVVTAGLALVSPTSAAPGDVNIEFDVLNIGTGYDRAYSLAVQSDGKVVVVGSADVGDVGSDKVVVVRYNSDGKPDTTFDADGVATTDVTPGADNAYDVVVQTDGRIVVAGYGSGGSLGSEAFLVRYNTDGSLDASFGTGGKAMFNVGADTTNDFFNALTLADGKIIAVGHSNFGSSFSSFLTARFDTNGVLDTTFNGVGYILSATGSDRSEAHDVVVQSDGKIVVAGQAKGSGSFATDFAVRRYPSNGSLDMSFGSNGVAITQLVGSGYGENNSPDIARSVALQGDKILLGGFANYDPALVRYNADGSLDTTFDTDGKAVLGGKATNDDQANSKPMALQSDGKIVFGYQHSSSISVLRFTDTGSLDNSFGGGDGYAEVKLNSNYSAGKAVALQSDGGIIVAGFTKVLNADWDFAVVSFSGVAAPAVTPMTQTVSGVVGAVMTGSATLTASDFGGVVTYSAGVLPDGLTLDSSTGVVSGTPTAVSSATVTITGTAGAQTATATVTFSIVAAPAVTPMTQTVSGVVGAVMTGSATLTASDFGGVVTYSAGVLPDGLTLDSSTGVVSGTPTAVSSATVTITGTAGAQTATATVTFSIVAAPAVSPTTTVPATTTTVVAPANPSATSAPSAAEVNSLAPAVITTDTILTVAEAVSATFGGFTAGDTVRLVVASDPQVLGSAVADAFGSVTVSGVIPLDLSPGEHTLALIDDHGFGFRQTITVSAAILPVTGPTSPILLTKGATSSILLLLVLGTMLFWIGSRRRTPVD